MQWLGLAAGVAGLCVALSVVAAAAFRVVDPGATLTMALRSADGQPVRREWRSIERISPHLVRAVIAAEDSGFCTHRGFDAEAIRAALEARRRGAGQGGASSLSQQTAKNVWFWTGGGWPRKAGEAWMTVLIETIWTKRRILEVYLNVAEWGDGLFGAEAAAQARFGKAAADLNEQEAALLAAVLPSPNRWRLDPPGPYVRGRASVLRRRMQIVERDGLADCALQ